jgi:glycosyltransferase involved in cell wall biosynthesis
MKDLPLVSFCLFTYNQEKYIEEAIDGAFSQDYTNLEIIISDDSSTDETWSIIEKKVKQYSGQHQIFTNRNEKNLGLAAHVNKILYDFAKGEYLALAAGDDISMPKRISSSIEFLQKHEDVVALSTSLKVIDQNSILHAKQRPENIEDNIFDLNYYLSSTYKHINGPSRIVRRSLIEAFPPLNKNCPTEDTTMLLRAFMFGKVALLKEKLVSYRLHDNNLSSAEGLMKMKLDLIFKQYSKDLKFAKQNYFLSEEEKEKVEMKLKELKKERLVKPRKYNIVQRLKSKLC